MAKLFIFIPFNEGLLNKSVDLPKDAIQFQTEFAGMTNRRIGENINADIARIEVVYANTAFTVTAADYIIVFAHGDKDIANTLYSNTPKLTTPVATAITKLESVGAQNALKILFMCCFSGLAGHIAVTWKTRYRAKVVYGGDAAISSLYSGTRTQIKACCLALRILP